MKKKRFLSVMLVLILAMSMLTGCSDGFYSTTIDGTNTTDNTVSDGNTETSEPDPIVYEVMMYDNQGNNFLTFQGNQFTITPNRIKQWGYNTDGYWTSWYDTSSVVTIEVDGDYIQSCGSTLIFKDTRLEMISIPDTLSMTQTVSTDEETISEIPDEYADGYTLNINNENIKTYIGLRTWWYDIKEKGQHGSKIVLVQSQDGYNIGAFIGDDVTWEIADKLPKTTKIMIGEMPLFLHRCNFTVIDTALIEKAVQ